MRRKPWRLLSDSERAAKAAALLEEMEGAVVVVEGKKDVRALRKLGVEAIPWYSLDLDAVSGRVVILTDLDEEGNRLCSSLVEELSGKDVAVDAQTRGRIASLLDLRRFEEIDGKMKKKEVIEWQRHISTL